MFPDAGKLLTRLAHAVESKQKITFLFGSALTAQGSKPEERGVPNVSSLIQDVLARFAGTDQIENLERALKESELTQQYQTAMQFMIDCRGQGELNGLIASAVLKARQVPPGSNIDYEAIERNTDGWALRPGVEAVGRLVKQHPTSFASSILTSNFDPLLEVSLRKAGLNANAIALAGDGHFTNVLGTDTTNVVHFHGFWRGPGIDTLHTPTQLSRFRPLLNGSLRRLLRETLLVVIGYGGWSDVFTKTLVEVISEQTEALDVLWTFYSDNEDAIKTRNEALLEKFEALVGQRVVLYKGIDCHVLLPLLVERLAKADSKGRVIPISVTEIESSKVWTHVGPKEYGDLPPQTDIWVGRESELLSMLNSKAKVIVITGFGGSGKSTLAAKFLEYKNAAQELSFYNWSDCRELTNTLHTQIVRAVERVSRSEITAAQLKDSKTEDVIEILFDTLGTSKAVLVFDNIDQYVDLELGKTTGVMNMLLERALHRSHLSQFIFTGRPLIEYSDPDFLGLRLEGLSLDEAQELFVMRGVELDPTRSLDLMKEVQTHTRGHALALNLIATQVSKNKINLEEFLKKLQVGLDRGEEIQILPEIWATLNTKQQTVLRYLAELVHAETEQRIASYLDNVLRFNQFSKAIKTLKLLSLVVIKSPGNGLPDLLELHPLVRDFIRRRFKKEERVPYIHSIILFCDRMILELRSKITQAPAKLLENWTDKVDLCLECGRYDEALDVLLEVDSYLRKNGLVEEFIRLAVEILNVAVEGDDNILTAKRDRLRGHLIHSLSALGRYREADEQIERMAKSIPAKTARYVLLCDIKAFSYFLRGEFVNARNIALEGSDLKRVTNIDTEYDCEHNLALAKRETGDVEGALAHFLGGEALEKVVSPGVTDKNRSGEFYGNIGRCLFYKGEMASAIVCLKKSVVALEASHDNAYISLNAGWGAFWVAEALEKMGSYSEAYVAYRAATSRWKSFSPTRAKLALESSEKVRKLLSSGNSISLSDSECDAAYIAWSNKC